MQSRARSPHLTRAPSALPSDPSGSGARSCKDRLAGSNYGFPNPANKRTGLACCCSGSTMTLALMTLDCVYAIGIVMSEGQNSQALKDTLLVLTKMQTHSSIATVSPKISERDLLHQKVCKPRCRHLNPTKQRCMVFYMTQPYCGRPNLLGKFHKSLERKTPVLLRLT